MIFFSYSIRFTDAPSIRRMHTEGDRMNRKRIIFLLACVFSLTVCLPEAARTECRAVPLAKARNVGIEKGGSWTRLRVRNPIPGASEENVYILVSRDVPLPPDIPSGRVICVPVRTYCNMSTTLIPFLEAMDGLRGLRGQGGRAYVFTKALDAAVVADLGPGNAPDPERILSLAPEIVFAYASTPDELETIRRLESLGLSVMSVTEFAEEHPLGRAEWIRVFGLLFGRTGEAEELYRSIRTSYESLASRAAALSARPGVLVNDSFNGVWYVPGGMSWPAILIRDAGGDYLLDTTDRTWSAPVDFETIAAIAAKADFWLNPGVWKTLDDGVLQDPRYRSFRPFREGNVYNNNARTTPAGGSDFHESGALRPDLILADLIAILHPNLLPAHRLYYYRKLEWKSGAR
jgi:iron complex transport system substrate-binding protein